MKLISTHLLNFRLHSDTFIDFEQGMTGIIGDNESGKSTISEAIRWALFGAKALRKTVKTLRWVMAPSRNVARVVLIFEVGGVRYEIDRSEGNAVLVDIKAAKKIAEGVDAVNEFVPKLIGMDMAEFDATYMCGQKDIGRLVNMKGTARKQFILKIMGVGRIDEGLKACREKKNALKTEAEGMEAGLGERPTEVVVITKEELRVAKDSASTYETTCAAAAMISESADEAFGMVDEKKEEHNQLVARSGQTSENIDHLTRSIQKAEAELTVATEALQRSEEIAPQILELPDLMDRRRDQEQAKTQQQEYQRVRLELEELLQRRDGIEAAIDELAEIITDPGIAVDEDDLKKALDSEEKAYQLIAASLVGMRMDKQKAESSQQALEEAGKDGACPTCNRELGNAYGYVMNSLSDHINNLEGEIEIAEATAEVSRTAITVCRERHEKAIERGRQHQESVLRQVELIKQRDQLRRDISQKQVTLGGLEAVKFDQGEYDLLIEQINELQALHDEKTAMDAKAERIADLNTDIAGFQNNRDGHREEKQKVAAKIRELNFDDTEWKRLKDYADECTDKLTSAAQEKAAAAAKVEECQKAVERAEAMMDEYTERAGRLSVLKISLANHEKAAVRLAEFRTAMAGSIRPDLEELTSGFVQILTDGRHEAVLLSEDFEVTLLEGGIPAEVISGGTEDIVALAQRLSISQMIAQRAGHPLSLLILDEPFGSLDDVRRGNVLALLDRLKGTFEQTVAITHVDEVKNSVDNLITCQYDPQAQAAIVTQEEGAA